MKQAETQKQCGRRRRDGARCRRPTSGCSCPTQASPQAAVEWQAIRLTGQDALAVRASKKLRNDELLVTGFAGTRLRMELDRVPLWRGDHVAIKQLAEDFARYLYLPRLKDLEVLRRRHPRRPGAADLGAGHLRLRRQLRRGLGPLPRACAAGSGSPLADADTAGLLVKPSRRPATARCGDTETGRRWTTVEPVVDTAGNGGDEDRHTARAAYTRHLQSAVQPKRFHGTVTLDPTRVGRDASRIAEEVIAHLAGLVGAEGQVTLEIEAEIPLWRFPTTSCARSPRTAGP